mgnify:CR=1 FL=1
MQKHNWKINIVNEWTGEKRSIRYNGTVDEVKDFLLKLAEEDSDRYGTEGAWFFRMAGQTFVKKLILTALYTACIRITDY